MSETKTKKATALRDFSDAGTEQLFTKDQELTLDEGTFANYEAAGLIRAGGPDAKPADAGKSKPAA
jgi:hypothetical protein